MGSMITCDPWLLTLATRGPRQHRVAGTLMRVQIVASARQHHLIDLGTDQVRRAVVHSAAWGHIANIPVRCSRCGCIAGLPSWARYASLSREGQEDARALAGQDVRPWLHSYMQACPGEEYARDLASITSLPVEKEG